MSVTGSVNMQDVQEDRDNNSPLRPRKLRPSTRRFSKRKVYREKRRLLTLQKKQERVKSADDTAVGQHPEEVAEESMVEAPSTSDGRNHTPQETMHSPSDEDTGTASAGEIEEVLEELKTEIPEGTDVESNEEENFVVEKVAKSEPQ
ncbi:uncharacterized protein LOC143369795 [Andrena cerasifolii]|uniref:uncharacterized protein LOC143369795 n=1 Tax=Andrena cerasifolii TaxID=2819439 RepID=UPI004037DE41